MSNTNPESEEQLKPTMIDVWEELDTSERIALASLCGIDVGQLSLSKVSTVLKALYYKHYFSQQGVTQVSALGQHYGIGVGASVVQTRGLYSGSTPSLPYQNPQNTNQQLLSQQQMQDAFNAQQNTSAWSTLSKFFGI